MTNATIRKVAPQESDADEEETQNTTHSGSDGGGNPVVGADAKILKKPGLGKIICVIKHLTQMVRFHTRSFQALKNGEGKYWTPFIVLQVTDVSLKSLLIIESLLTIPLSGRVKIGLEI